ncbi:MAG: GTP-binding protein TypA/BipA [Parcubacteria group bacterium GW2011_GWC1_38_17]|nr:MAG: GTP-binding protein TypA/BipA [Parcubacteria group bacterium GW2011_GWC2_36_17]KKQ58550.1 MAG: GTP-binding protein TypA/BipA [Parcubacteria group bacterium GW2011_GWC1_38_17]KKQ59213.1 MAG: GTP-binding protein TypA/BipA [Parcubacteria group bacterium GW2011_GWD1_38_16]
MNKLLRNIAIIAHVDHGKTTLVDEILKQTGSFDLKKTEGQKELVMDSMDLERERGITIKAKNASVKYKDIKINIIDTPGHADFGGEVERVLRMADGVLLLVDAKEGPMPQTKFVLRKALELGHKVIVVVNKIDKPDARAEYVVDKVLELFIELNANDDQLDFPVVYASGAKGVASLDLEKAMQGIKSGDGNLIELFDLVLKEIPSPHGDKTAPLQILILNLFNDNFKGRIGVGRVDNGIIKTGQMATLIKRDGSHINSRITALLAFDGMERTEVPELKAGDIVALAGFENIEIGDTVADSTNPIALPLLKIDEPTVEMTFKVNDSPFGGREGKFSTSRNLRDRLFKELETNVSLRVKETDSPDSYVVAGRGELHLAILIEQMRREGFEFAVSKPEVIYREIDGIKMEPVESLTIEAPEEYAGTIIDVVGRRKGVMENMSILPSGEQHFDFIIPTRGIIGLKGMLMIATRGTAQVHHLFLKYAPVVEGLDKPKHSSMISMENGKVVGYSLYNLQERGTIFAKPGDEVYVGQIIGESNRQGDEMEVNPCKEKQQSNVRSKSSDEAITLIPPRLMTLEGAIEYIDDDELLEVTPVNLRIRKKILDSSRRKRAK